MDFVPENDVYILHVVLDSAKSNRVISNSPLFQTLNHFLSICPSISYYRLLRTPAIYNYNFVSRESVVQQ